MSKKAKIALVVVAAAALGLVFATYSTYDYVAHLDRQMHAVHCSFIPGAPVSADADNACKTALFSPYSAIFRETYWGGVPISLFAVGSFAFFIGFGAYVYAAKEKVSRAALGFLGIATLGPFAASLVMFVISATKLHSFCKLCAGIYVSSIALAIAGGFAFVEALRAYRAEGNASRAGSDVVLALGLSAGLGIAAVLPALLYVVTLPDYRPYLTKCGSVPLGAEPHGALVKLRTSHPVQKATLFEDPLCPTCKAFHQRLVADDVLDKLDITLVLFPLDTSCNWMIDRSLHPGACLVSGAILCSGDDARAALEWAYDNQDDLHDAGKAGADAIKAKIAARFGPTIAACAADRKTSQRLNQNLHYASTNHVPVSTPQMFLGDRRVCEEDTDLGLKYTLAQLAPDVVK
jgi:uncharacterized membrane protein